MTRTETELPGVFLVQPRVLHDARGAFLKTYHAGIFSDLGFPFVPVEEFISISHRNVIRGMHCSHGFLALTDDATMVYQTNTVHAPASDAGVRWNSFGFDWSVPAPRLSERDRALPSLAEFTSPF